LGAALLMAGSGACGAQGGAQASDSVDERPRWLLRSDASGASIVRFDNPSKPREIAVSDRLGAAAWSDDGTVLAQLSGEQVIFAHAADDFEPRAVDVDVEYPDGPRWIGSSAITLETGPVPDSGDISDERTVTWIDARSGEVQRVATFTVDSELRSNDAAYALTVLRSAHGLIASEGSSDDGYLRYVQPNGERMEIGRLPSMEPVPWSDVDEMLAISWRSRLLWRPDQPELIVFTWGEFELSSEPAFQPGTLPMEPEPPTLDLAIPGVEVTRVHIPLEPTIEGQRVFGNALVSAWVAPEGGAVAYTVGRQDGSSGHLAVRQHDGDLVEHEGANRFVFSDSRTYLYSPAGSSPPRLILQREGKDFDVTPPLDDYELSYGPLLLPWGQFIVVASTDAATTGFIIDPSRDPPTPIPIDIDHDVSAVQAPPDPSASPHILAVGAHTSSIVEVPSGDHVASLVPWADHTLWLTPDGDGLVAWQETSAVYVPIGSETGVQLYQDVEKASVRMPPRWPSK
jgi:hypothetical protein